MSDNPKLTKDFLTQTTTTEKTTTYTYGTKGELKEVTTPTKTISYQQNALNQRVAKLVDGEVVEKYLWANLTTLLAIYEKDDTLVQRFEYAGTRMPVAMTNASATKYYLHYDQVGSLRAVSDAQHNIVKEITYDTYGNILTETNLAMRVPFGFAGGLYDSDTKLTRFGYRDYDAYTGKWTAKDPIGFGGGDSNLYGYVLGDPVDFVDPKGLKPDKDKVYYCSSWSSSDHFHNFICAGGKCTGLTIRNLYGGGLLDNNLGDFDNYNNEGKCEVMKPEGKKCNKEYYNTCMLYYVNLQGSTEYGYDLVVRNCKTWSTIIEDICRTYAGCK